MWKSPVFNIGVARYHKPLGFSPWTWDMKKLRDFKTVKAPKAPKAPKAAK